MNIYEHFKLINDGLERRTRGNGEFTAFKTEFSDEHEAIWQKLIETQTIGGDLDFWYTTLESLADIITDQASIEGGKQITEERAHELVDELEADIYTTKLCKWLANHPDHVNYLTQAITDYGITDGFSALTQAQQLALEDVGHQLVDAISELAQVTA